MCIAVQGAVPDGLVELSADLSDVLGQARAPSTKIVYTRAFEKWKKWTTDYEDIRDLPADPLHVALYLTHLSKTAATFSSINQAISAIAWAHGISGMDSPTGHIMVKETINGLKRKLAKPCVRKEPFEPNHIRSFFDVLVNDSVSDLRNTTLIVLSFYALLRFDEVSRLKCKDISLSEDFVEIHIDRSKRDQLRQGDTVLVASMGGKYCPVELLINYLQLSVRCSGNNYEHFLFRRCITNNKKVVLTSTNTPMTYSSIRDIVKAKAVQIGLKASSFSTHSMRAGGATAAANSSVSERALQRHGRWASSTSKDGYIKDKVDTRLSVSRAIAGTK